MEEYTPNSHKFRKEKQESLAEREKLNKVVKGEVKAQKNTTRKFTDAFISEDANNVKSFLWMDVIVPAIKDTVWSMITGGLDMVMYGGGKRNSKVPGASKVSYTRFYDERRDVRSSSTNSGVRSAYDYYDITLESRVEAAEVLARMDELIETYGTVSVADLYDLVGITGNYTDNKYGWTNIRTAEVVPVRGGGYKLKLPKVLPID